MPARELFLLKRYSDGARVREIASESGESPSAIRGRVRALQKRVFYRLSKRSDYGSRAKVPAPVARMKAFAELQRRLALTSSRADAWQNAVNEAPR